MNEIEVKLPVCKGTAFLRSRLSDGRMDVIDDIRASRLPQGALAILYRAWESKELDRDTATDEQTTQYLVSRGVTPAEIRRADKEADRLYVRTVVKRWANVFGPESDTELSFPDGIPELDPDDFDFLLAECMKAVAVGRADPNAGGERSSEASSRDADTIGSLETSEMRSDSILSTVA